MLRNDVSSAVSDQCVYCVQYSTTTFVHRVRHGAGTALAALNSMTPLSRAPTRFTTNLWESVDLFSYLSLAILGIASKYCVSGRLAARLREVGLRQSTGRAL